MKYVSRYYLCEKYERLKWDLVKYADIYGENTAEDKIDEKTIKQIRDNVIYCCKAIIHELGGDD